MKRDVQLLPVRCHACGKEYILGQELSLARWEDDGGVVITSIIHKRCKRRLEEEQ